MHSEHLWQTVLYKMSGMHILKETMTLQPCERVNQLGSYNEEAFHCSIRDLNYRTLKEKGKLLFCCSK